MFRILDPDMPFHESISVLCKVILDRDPSAMVKLIKQIIPDIPNQDSLKLLGCLLDLLVEANLGEVASLQKNLLFFLKSLLQGSHFKYF
jgi:hypothetical protein